MTMRSCRMRTRCFHDLTPKRREVETQDGNWFIRSILPYRNEGGTVGGVVITFTRISEMKAAEQKIEAAKAYAESIIATVKQPLAVLDGDLRIVSASASYFKVFDVKPEDSIGRPFTLGPKHRPEALAKFLEAASEGNAIEDYEVGIDLPNLGAAYSSLVPGGSLRGRPNVQKYSFPSTTSRMQRSNPKRLRPPRKRPSAPTSENPASSPRPATICASRCRRSACCRACWPMAFPIPAPRS